MALKLFGFTQQLLELSMRVRSARHELLSARFLKLAAGATIPLAGEVVALALGEHRQRGHARLPAQGSRFYFPDALGAR